MLKSNVGASSSREIFNSRQLLSVDFLLVGFQEGVRYPHFHVQVLELDGVQVKKNHLPSRIPGARTQVTSIFFNSVAGAMWVPRCRLCSLLWCMYVYPF